MQGGSFRSQSQEGNRESHDLHRRTKENPTPCPTWCGRSLGARVIFSALGLGAMEDEQRPPEHPYPSPQESLSTSPSERSLVRPVRKMQIVSRFRALACRNPTQNEVHPAEIRVTRPHRRTKENPTPCPTWVVVPWVRESFSLRWAWVPWRMNRGLVSLAAGVPFDKHDRAQSCPTCTKNADRLPLSCARMPQPTTQNEVRPDRKSRVTRPASEDEREPDPCPRWGGRSLGARVIFSALGLGAMEDEQRPPEHPYPSPQESLSTSTSERSLVRPVRKMQIVSHIRALACRNPPPKTTGNEESHDLRTRPHVRHGVVVPWVRESFSLRWAWCHGG